MSKGVILFAHNTPKTDYFKMATITAQRINHFLNLPVSVVTNTSIDVNNYDYKFDNVYYADKDESNKKDKEVWMNKGRFRCWEYTPYDETIVLDTDYMVNSSKLLNVFDYYDDFATHNTTSFLMRPDAPQERMSNFSYNTLWATVMFFKKTSRTKQLFQCLEMVQQNYDHYANIHNFVAGLYRNDYGLSMALRAVNGQTECKRDYIPWPLLHVGQNTHVYRNDNWIYNTEYTVLFDNWTRGKIRKEYITVKDTDFHVMNKQNFLELIND